MGENAGPFQWHILVIFTVHMNLAMQVSVKKIPIEKTALSLSMEKNWIENGSLFLGMDNVDWL